MFIRKLSILTVTVMAGLMIVNSAAQADYGTKKHKGKWDKKHPRQAEVNGRLQNQENRVNQGEANGSLTKQEGNKIEGQDKKIYKQEQRMKARNGANGITKEHQAKLNKEENGVSNEIKKDESANTAAPAPVAPAAPGN